MPRLTGVISARNDTRKVLFQLALDRRPTSAGLLISLILRPHPVDAYFNRNLEEVIMAKGKDKPKKETKKPKKTKKGCKPC